MLFEALEKVLAGTAHATLVNDLYQVKTINGVYIYYIYYIYDIIYIFTTHVFLPA